MDMKQYKQLQVEGSGWSFASAWGDQMERAIIEWFAANIPKDACILDVGCGEGRGLMALKQLGFSNLYGIDLSDEKVKVAQGRGFRVEIADMHEMTCFPQVKFDYVFTSHTLEHAYDLEKAIKAIAGRSTKAIYFIVPINETQEEVDKYNPSHTSSIKLASDFTAILDKLGLKHETYEKQRLCTELWGIIHL